MDIRNEIAKYGVFKGSIDCALGGDINKAIEICESVCPDYNWNIKRRRSALNHKTDRDKDVEWTGVDNSAKSLMYCIYEVLKRNDRLEDCPFCGGDSEIVDASKNLKATAIGCLSCGATLTADVDDLISIWNLRNK